MKLYIETSVANMLFTLKVPEKRIITERLFEEIREGIHKIVVSSVFLDEVRKTPSVFLRYQLEGIIKVYDAEVINVTEDVENVADAYIQAQAFTENNYADALHVAVAVCGGCEVIVSWNFRHIVRAWTMKRVVEVNRRLGLPDVIICTPEEVIGDVGDPGSGE
jgi:predicted nucleic acid-binding protein